MFILVWLLIGFGIYYFIKNNGISKTKYNNGSTPEDILKERYAKGEIDDATFEKMKMTINR